MDKPKEVSALSGEQILASVDAILAQQGAKKEWNQAAHVACITLAAKQCFPTATPEQRKQFLLTLKHKGLGGNASQFRQWLEGQGADEPKRLTPAGKVVSGYVVD